MVKYVGAYTLLGYLVVIICYLAAWCHPVTAYWAVPVSACKTPIRSGSHLAQSNLRELLAADHHSERRNPNAHPIITI